MSQYSYLLALIVAISGMTAIDRAYKLAFWYRAKRTVFTIATSMISFVVLDLILIHQGVFMAGDSQYFMSFRLLPEFPVEELFFLFLLSYTTLVIYRFGETRWPHTRS